MSYYTPDIQLKIIEKEKQLILTREEIEGYLDSMRPLMDQIKWNICSIGTAQYIDFEKTFKDFQSKKSAELEGINNFDDFIKKLYETIDDLQSKSSLIEEKSKKGSDILECHVNFIAPEGFKQNVLELASMLQDSYATIPSKEEERTLSLFHKYSEWNMGTKKYLEGKVKDRINNFIRTLKFNECIQFTRSLYKEHKYIDVCRFFKDFQREHSVQDEADRAFFPLNFFNQDDFLQLATDLKRQEHVNKSEEIQKMINTIESNIAHRNGMEQLQRKIFTSKELEELKRILTEVGSTLSDKLVEKESFVDFIESIERVPAKNLMELSKQYERLNSFFAFVEGHGKQFISEFTSRDLDCLRYNRTNLSSIFSHLHRESYRSSDFRTGNRSYAINLAIFHEKFKTESLKPNWIEGTRKNYVQQGLQKCQHEKSFLSSSLFNKSYINIPVTVMLFLSTIILPSAFSVAFILTFFPLAPALVPLLVLGGMALAFVGLFTAFSFSAQSFQVSCLKDKREELARLQYDVINKKINENENHNIKALQSNLHDFLQKQPELSDSEKDVLKEAYARFKDDFLKRTLIFSPDFLLNQEEMIPLQFDDFLMLAKQAQEKLDPVLTQDYNEQDTESVLITQLDSEPFIYEAEHKLNYAINPVCTVALVLSVLKDFEEYLPKYRASLDQEKSLEADRLVNKFSSPVLHSREKGASLKEVELSPGGIKNNLLNR